MFGKLSAGKNVVQADFGSFSGAGVEYMIVGLGNPDSKYNGTRHNTGFFVLDTLAQQYGARVDRVRFKGLTGTCRIGNTGVLLLKPTTYMNLSGQSVTEAMRFYKLPPEKVLVVFDDISLAVGNLRIRQKGSDGGHNGMKNIIYLSGSDRFPRVKVGIGSKPEGWDLADWVLSHFTEKEAQLLTQAAQNVCQAVPLLIGGDFELAMNRFNRVQKPQSAAPDGKDTGNDTK